MSLTKTPPDSVLSSLEIARSSSSNASSPLGDHGNGHKTNGHKANGHAPIEAPKKAESDDHGLSMALASDIAADGTFGERWLLVDERHVRVFSPDGEGPAKLDLDVPLSDLKLARAEMLVGNGVLELVTKDGRVLQAVRYTQALAPQFNGAARALESFIIGETPPESVLEGFERKFCKKCGLPLPEDTSVCTACIDKRATIARMMGYGAPYKAQAAGVVFLSLFGVLLSLITPILTTRVLTDMVLIPHQHESWIGLIVIAAIVLAIAGLAVSVWRARLAAWLMTHMVFSLRTEVYNKFQTLSLSYYDKRQAGSLTARVTQDVNELRNFLVDGVQFFFVNSLQIIGILIVMLRFNPRLTLLALIPVPLTIYLTRKMWHALWRRMHRFWHLRSTLAGLVNTVFSGMRVVKAFAQEQREEERFREKSYGLFQAELTVERSLATIFPILAIIATAGTFIIYYSGGREVFHTIAAAPAPIHGASANSVSGFFVQALKSFVNPPPGGKMTLGTLQLFLVYLGMLMGPIQGMTRIADWLSRSSAAAERVFEVLDTDVEVDDDQHAIAMPYIYGAVELKDVRFTYDKNKMVLEGVSIDVKPGEMIGLVGHSGAGKSTIINLLSRFYDVTDGQILIDGIDIKKIKVDDLRRQIGVVLQEPFLFPGTVRDNIAYAKPDASIEEIMRAAKAANAHDFVMRLPDGYDTWVGERGARLSGGERQRISIARAILHDPRILILDEATASVDTETEKQIQEAISHLVQGRTTFAIAHRLSTLRNADRLMVMEKGKVAELGTHDELLSKPEGVYKRLVDMQQAVNKLREETVVL
jgi:ATP-binding cassette subfamily B protein